MNHRTLFASIALVAWSPFAVAEGWSPIPNFGGAARFLAASFSIGNFGYVGTGFISGGIGGTPTQDFWRFDPNTNAWTQVADFGGGVRYAAVGFSIGNKGYVGTGTNGTDQSDLWQYDPQTNAWTQKAPFPGAPRRAAIAFESLGFGYIGTGVGATTYSDMWQYDPNNNTWAPKASYGGGPRHGASVFVVQGSAYVTTGIDGSGNLTSDMWVYSPFFADIWTAAGAFPGLPRAYASAFAVGNYGYICGGSGPTIMFTPTTYNDVWSFNGFLGGWNQRSAFPGLGRTQCTAMAIGNKGYMGLGGSGFFPAYGFYDQWWAYDPQDCLGEIGGNALPGTACNDLDACTLSDVWSANCICGGTYTDTDNDGLCDGDDCDPNDPFVTGPQPWFPDDDGDGLGDQFGIIQCTPPPGWVANNFDGCPTIYGTVGDPCDDGNPCTTPDIINFACQCLGGLPLDTDGDGTLDCNDPCPLLPNLVNGDPCDDNDPCTANDVVTNCTCAGTPSGIPTPTASNAGPFCVGDPLVLNGTAGGGFIFSWTGPSGPVSANLNANLGPATPSMAGVYTFQSSNGTCTGSATTTVVVNAAPSLSFSTTPETCPGQNDGAIDLTVNGGVGTPTYNWSSNIPCAFDPQCPLPLLCLPGPFTCGANNSVQDLSGLPAAQYTVTVNMGGCSVSQTITVGTASPDTDGDAVVDCLDNCPAVPGQIGSPCNDNDPNTINDVITGGCQCAGTPSCAGTQVTLTLNTDGNAAQTTWDIVATNTNNIVCSGGGHPNNSTISVNCCLPNGCYDLRVFDSAGDGINPGGFVLRDANNERIIDDLNNGPNFTTLSKVTSTTNNPVGFCVPIGTDAITPTSCDLTGLTLNSVVSAVANAGVSAQYGIGDQTDDGYQFWVFNPNGGYSRRIFFSHASPGTGWPNAAPVAERCSYFRLSAMNSAPAIPSNVLLNIRVRSRINGVNSEFGPACRLTIGTANTCALTQLTTTANPLISCGATGVNRITGVLWSNAVTGANRYQFQFVNANTNVLLRNLASPTRNLNMATWGNAVPLPTCFQPYNVRVRVSFNNGATYCAWGPWCTVTFTCPPQAGRGMEAITGTGEITLGVYPNPSDGGALQLAIGGLDPEAGTVDLDVLDALGRTVITEQRPVRATQGILLLNWPARPAPGSYLVRVRQGDRHAQQRVMVQ